MPDLIKPKKLKAGDTIGIIAPSSRTDMSFIEEAAANLQSRGFKTMIHPQCYQRDRGAAGTTQEKIAAIHDVFSNPEIDAVFVTRGGSRALHLLDGIDYDLIRRNPKLFLGFSDATTLLCAFYVQAGLVTFHGMTTAGFNPKRNPLTPEKNLPFLTGDWSHGLWPEEDETETLREGDVSGNLVGGNLSMLVALAVAGPKYFPDMKNKILLLEDIGEEIRGIDRMLGALRLRGVFDEIAGLVVGQMTDITDTSETGILFERTFREVLEEHTADMKGPIVWNAPIGHEHPNIPFPIGIKARLTAPSGGKPQLQLLESPFSD